MKPLVVYWSGTGNTQKMAACVAAGMGGAELAEVGGTDASQIDRYDKIAFGCPSMGAEALEESEFEPFFSDVENKLSGKKVALFGSYGWGDGEWMRDWERRAAEKGAVLFEQGLIINETPDSAGCEQCRAFGERFANF